MNIGKNQGTVIRTIARIVASAFSAFCVWQTVVDGFGNKTVSLIWAILIIAFGWGVDFFTHYFNNDFTEVAAKHTADMRTEKKRLEDPTYADSFDTDDGGRVVDDEEDDEIDAVEFTEGGDAE